MEEKHRFLVFLAKVLMREGFGDRTNLGFHLGIVHDGYGGAVSAVSRKYETKQGLSIAWAGLETMLTYHFAPCEHPLSGHTT